MGEPEVLVAEPDELEVKEEAKLVGVHPSTLDQQNPWLITEVFTAFSYFLADYGWYILGFLVFICIVWQKWKHKIKDWQKKREEDKEAAEYHKNPDKVLAREKAMYEARLRMQERYSREAEIAEEKRKEREEAKRQERVDEWDRLQRAEGYHNRSRHTSPDSPASTPVTPPPRTSAMRGEYNPLTGGGGGVHRAWGRSQRSSRGG